MRGAAGPSVLQQMVVPPGATSGLFMQANERVTRGGRVAVPLCDASAAVASMYVPIRHAGAVGVAHKVSPLCGALVVSLSAAH